MVHVMDVKVGMNCILSEKNYTYLCLFVRYNWYIQWKFGLFISENSNLIQIMRKFYEK